MSFYLKLKTGSTIIETICSSNVELPGWLLIPDEKGKEISQMMSVGYSLRWENDTWVVDKYPQRLTVTLVPVQIPADGSTKAKITVVTQRGEMQPNGSLIWSNDNANGVVISLQCTRGSLDSMSGQTVNGVYETNIKSVQETVVITITATAPAYRMSSGVVQCIPV